MPSMIFLIIRLGTILLGFYIPVLHGRAVPTVLSTLKQLRGDASDEPGYYLMQSGPDRPDLKDADRQFIRTLESHLSL